MACSDNFDDILFAQVGGKAPDFEANAYYKGEFTTVRLSDYLNDGKWVVLFFYPLDFTFVCPTEIKQFSEKVAAFEAEGAQIIGVSVDSEHSHKAWCEGDLGQLNFPLVADLKKEISDCYGVLHPDGVSFRGTFIIQANDGSDSSGEVRHSTINDLPIGRSVDETLRTLQAAKSGELCPVGWNKGEDTLGKA